MAFLSKKNRLICNSIFGRSASTFLEIGFGMGETTAAIARENPENDYIAVEVHTPGVGSLLKQTRRTRINECARHPA